MFYQLDLITLLLAPLITYLAAALVFSLISKRDHNQSLPLSATNLHYHDGHNS